MYSIVLVAALATSATPNWCHRQACSGCYAGYSGYSCYSGYAGYAGYSGYSCYGCQGCSATVRGYGAAGGCYGYHGGCYGGFGVTYADPFGGGCTGCYGCYGGHSGYGVPVPLQVNPAPRTPAVDPFPPINPKKDAEEVPIPKEKDKKKKEKETEQSRAKVRIEIPAGGKLFVDGRHINVAAGTRIFQTPPLGDGQTYFYDIRIEVESNGATRGEEQRVIVRPGDDALVSFPTLRAPGTYAARTGR